MKYAHAAALLVHVLLCRHRALGTPEAGSLEPHSARPVAGADAGENAEAVTALIQVSLLTTPSEPFRAVNQSATALALLYGRLRVYNVTNSSKPKDEIDSYFVDVEYVNTSEGVIGVLHVATATDIAIFASVLLLPIATVWGHWWNDEKAYTWLMQITIVAFTFLYNLANQSICAITDAPMTLTFLQTAVGSVACCFWAKAQLHLGSRETISFRDFGGCIWVWLPASALYAAYTITNHMVSETTSLTERTVFSSLTSVFAFVVEMLCSLCAAEPSFFSPAAKMSMLTMALGTCIFTWAYPDITVFGFQICMLWVILKTFTRILERRKLPEIPKIPVTLLVSFDFLVSSIASCFLTGVELQGVPMSTWLDWLQDPSLITMFAISTLCFFTADVMMVTLLQKREAATLVVVLSQLSNALLLVSGNLFFADNLLSHTAALVGVAISMSGCIAYCVLPLFSSKTVDA